MKCDKKNMLLYAVTDRMWTGKRTLYEQIEDALKGGITCLQLREKHLDNGKFLEEALKIKSLCNRYNVPLIINDNVDIALKSRADGVHVGQNDMKAENVRKLVGENMIIGVSARTVEQALIAETNGADYLGVGAVFNTSTKTDASSVSFQTVSEICKAVSIPVVAIGGISSENILQLSGLGTDGVALVSAIFSAENIEQECRKLRSLSEKMVNG